MRAPLLTALLCIAAASTGCHTMAGRFLENRARDLGDCVRVRVSTGVGIGGGARLAGLATGGLGGGVSHTERTVGFEYGRLLWPGRNGHGYDVHLFLGPLTYRTDPTGRGQEYVGDWLAALRTETQGWWWDRERFARVHAFDIEADLYLIGIGLHVGISPGELFDFAVGWLGLDPARDDAPVWWPGGEKPKWRGRR